MLTDPAIFFHHRFGLFRLIDFGFFRPGVWWVRVHANTFGGRAKGQERRPTTKQPNDFFSIIRNCFRLSMLVLYFVCLIVSIQTATTTTLDVETIEVSKERLL